MEIAFFGAGCFWGVQDEFDKIKGVISTRVGYMGGNLKNPTYKDVCTDKTGHAEIVEIEYNPEFISYKELLNIFWKIHDPTQLNKQGPDIGSQYRSVIFYIDKEEKNIAEKTKLELEKSGLFKKRITTEIISASNFYPAEEYHQKYYKKHGLSHCKIS